MKKTTPIQKLTVLAVAGSVLISVSGTLAATTGSLAVPLAGIPGTGATGVEFISGTQGDLTIAFPARSVTAFPVMSYGRLAADARASQGAFVGDYLSAGVKGLILKVRNNDGVLPSHLSVELKSSSGGTWNCAAVQISDAAGESATSTLLFDRRIGWDRSMPEDLKDELWALALQDVASICVKVAQDGVLAQSFTVDDVVLFGDGFMTAEANLVAGLMENFGATGLDQLSPGQLRQDSDRDGVSDVDQITAGQDPGLAVEILDVTTDGVFLEWPCVDKLNYVLYRSADLTEEFTAIVGPILANQNGYMQYVDGDATGTGPYYYKVKKIR